ncbi:alkaline phosphatase [Gynurincola endophyticus]|uniref:alkaline phosphatase n=1 Tax=Gynurincola endophyticus TaxID=2479004 RepID=UPI000F8DAD10|nr:alkaline phosphatase [Gynurincola endophyticus]
MKSIRFFIILLIQLSLFSQGKSQITYNTSNAHSHNDYEQRFPFWSAYYATFGSIEVDVFLNSGNLIVAHDQQQVLLKRTIDSLYLEPIQKILVKQNGFIYKDTSRKLQLMIDIKTQPVESIDVLLKKLEQYPEIINSQSIQIVITGNQPPVDQLKKYPEWIWFDGNINQTYEAETLKRIALFSENFKKYSNWNGKGRIPGTELLKIKSVIQKAHQYDKRIRFWGAPDIVNSWYAYIEMGIDLINTDHIDELSGFLETLPDRYYKATATHQTYNPTYRNDGMDRPVKNIILLIGDGTGLPQWYAGYTANNQALNVFKMRQIGFSKTSSYDNYITDSAPGASAFSTGKKSNNRHVGVDHTGMSLPLITDLVDKKGMKTGVVTTGDMRDATPASFYAHQSERSNYGGILKDVLKSPINLLVGSGDIFKDTIFAQVQNLFDVFTSIEKANWKSKRPVIISDSIASKRAEVDRGDWSLQAFEKSLQRLSENKNGFLLVYEAAQVDHGGHANQLPVVVRELKDFDKVIGEAMKFADKNGETLIVITGDHETGGLTLTAGEYAENFISGQFSTGDHTAIPVPVFAYGPQSHLFRGVYENTEIFYKMLIALKIKSL